MKNTRIFLAVMAVAMLFVASCQKESLVKQEFSARMEADASDAKTTLVGSNLQWQHGSDQVSITSIATTTNENNQSQVSYTTSTFTARTHSSNNPAYANLTLDDNQEELAEGSNVTYRAIYPAGAARDNNTKIILPRTQESTSGELTGYPMYAESDSKSIQFKNLCSVLKLSLTGTGSINKIEVSTDKYINGTFTINPNNPDAPLEYETSTDDHTKLTTLTMGSPVSISSTQYFFIYLPVQEYKYIRINIYNTDGNVYTKEAIFPCTINNTTVNSLTLERSKYHQLTIENVVCSPKLLSGKFSVSANQKVCFSRGNLLLVSSSSSQSGNTYTITETYKFADNQYDRKDNGTTYDKWLFEWGNNDGSTTMNTRWKSYSESIRTGIFTTTTYNHTNCSIQNAGNSADWRCLSSEVNGDGRRGEWYYLLHGRHVNGKITYYNKSGIQNTGTGESDTRAFTMATIQTSSETSVKGMIIFPDLFYWPLDNKEPAAFGSGSSWSNTNNTFTLNEWKILEGAGCVFLPTTGCKRGSDAFNNENTYGYYWSTSYANSVPHYLTFGGNSSSAFSTNQSSYSGATEYYYAIRLVKDI